MWIEIHVSKALSSDDIGSRPARALWIEIGNVPEVEKEWLVEAREGLVD